MKDVFKYITQNSVKEGLVAHPSHWGGLHGYHHLVEDKPLSGPWLNRSKLYASQRLKKPLTEADVTTIYHIELTPPLMWRDLSPDEYRTLCHEFSEEAIREAHILCKGKSPMGMKRVLAQKVLKARKAKSTTGPLCRAKCLERLKAYREAYVNFNEVDSL